MPYENIIATEINNGQVLARFDGIVHFNVEIHGWRRVRVVDVCKQRVAIGLVFF